jgi:endo-1,4-beta-xylanase
MDISNNGGYYQLGVRDGTTESYNELWNLPISSSQPIQIIFDQVNGKSFTVFDKDGNNVQHIDLTQRPQLKLPNGLFPEGNVYIGTSTAPHSSSIVTGLNIGETSDGKWADQQDSGLGLADLAKNDNITIGTIFSNGDMMNLRGCRIMKMDFDLVSLGDFSWKGYWLGPDQYDFGVLDNEVTYANQMGWRVRAMHLVWGAPDSTIPDWLLTGNFTRDQYIQILHQHVTTLVQRYKGRIQEWSIANEAPARSYYPGTDFWNDKIGPDYVEMAFRWAREADPNGVLIFNQDNNESPRDYDTSRTIDKMYAMVKKLKDDGAPIDVVGMQMHLFLPWNSKIPPKKEDVIATMQKFASLGVRINITEMDVDLQRRPGTEIEKLNFQAQLYQDMLSACLESKVCDGFETWGISDSNSWITDQGKDAQVNDPNGEPLMFDKDYNPKSAFFAVQDVLANYPNIELTPTP